jgi:hypothetical protein
VDAVVHATSRTLDAVERPNRAGRLVLLCALLATLSGPSACFGCDTDACLRVTTIHIVPGSVDAGENATIALRAVPRDAMGGEVIEDLPVEWSGEGVEFLDDETNPVLVNVGAAGTRRIEVTIRGRATTGINIRVHSPFAYTADQLAVEHWWGAPVAHVVLDAPSVAAPVCGNWGDRRYSVAGLLTLPENLTENASCVNEVAVFTHDRGAVVRRPQPGWTNAFERLSQDPLPMPAWIAIRFWYFVDESESVLRTRALANLGYAGWAFRENRVGTQFGSVDHVVTGTGLSYTGGPQAETCNDLSSLTDLFNPEPGVIHVVYVRSIDWNSPPYGLACPSAPDRGDIVILAWDQPSGTTLAHELTHRFGFGAWPVCAGTFGHVTCVPGFTGENLMWTHADPLSNDERWFLTTGQVYRMQVERDSWLNRAGLRTHVNDRVKECASTGAPARCPELHFILQSP